MNHSKQMLFHVLRRLRAGITASQVAEKLAWSPRIVEKVECDLIPSNADQVIATYGQAISSLVLTPGEGEPITGRLCKNLIANQDMLTDREFIVLHGHALRGMKDGTISLPITESRVFWDSDFDPTYWLDTPFGAEIIRRGTNAGRNLGAAPPPATNTLRFDDLFQLEDVVTVRIKRAVDSTGTTTLSFERVGT